VRFDSGLLGHNGDVSNYPPIDEWTETLRILETNGYGGVWAAEHHFFWDGWTNPVPTNPVLFNTFAAGQTTRLKLGQCGVCLPDWHPIRVAEDVAMLDHMSKGRVEFGVIRGLNNRVNGNFHPNADRRDQKVNQALFWESLDIIELAWKGEPFRFEGQFYRFPIPGWHDVKTPRKFCRQRASIGMVFQHFNLFHNLTAIENIMEAPVAVQRIPRAEAREHAVSVLGSVGLSRFQDSYPSQLSGGQQQRVAIARALAMQPSLMLFDEPTSMLDPELVGEVLTVMRSLVHSGITMIVVTHELEFAREACDSLVFMDRGAVIEQGPPARVIETPRSERTREFLRRVRH